MTHEQHEGSVRRDDGGEGDEAHAQTAGAVAARVAGRGFLVISGAKVWFLVSASVLNFGLPVLFATPADYGTYGVVVSAVSLLNMVVITASLQAVAKLVSEQPAASGAVLRRAMLLQLFLALPLAGAFALAAEPLAAWLRDPAYAPLLRISALITAAYGFYALFVGAFNGLKLYTRQAALDILFSTLRTALILSAVAAGLGVAGAIGGFALASGVILVVAALWVVRTLRRPAQGAVAGPAVDGRRLLVFLLANLAYTFVLNALMRVDLFVLKRLSAVGGGDDAAAAALVATSSNALAGAYSLVVNVARLPYQAVIAIAFVIFPLLSRSTFENDLPATRAYLRNTMRYALLVVGALAAVLAGAGGDLLRPLYPDYAEAARALPELCVAYAFFALLYVSTTMLIAAGHPWLSSGLVALTLVLLTGLCQVLIGAAPVGAPMLDAAANAVLAATAAGLIGAGLLSVRLFGAFVRPASALRLGLIIALVIAAGQLTAFERFVDFHDPALGGLDAARSSLGAAGRSMLGSRTVWLAAGLGKAALLGLGYLALVALVELGPEDRERLRGVLGRRRNRQDAPQNAQTTP